MKWVPVSIFLLISGLSIVLFFTDIGGYVAKMVMLTGSIIFLIAAIFAYFCYPKTWEYRFYEDSFETSRIIEL